MDRQVIEQKLESLRRCLLRVKEKCPVDAESLVRDIDAQDIITLNLTRAVQLSVDLAAHLIASRDIPVPNTMAQAFEALASIGLISPALASRMKKAVGFRNIAIHNYEAIDWHMVHSIGYHPRNGDGILFFPGRHASAISTGAMLPPGDWHSSRTRTTCAKRRAGRCSPTTSPRRRPRQSTTRPVGSSAGRNI